MHITDYSAALAAAMELHNDPAYRAMEIAMVKAAIAKWYVDTNTKE